MMLSISTRKPICAHKTCASNELRLIETRRCHSPVGCVVCCVVSVCINYSEITAKADALVRLVCFNEFGLKPVELSAIYLVSIQLLSE